MEHEKIMVLKTKDGFEQKTAVPEFKPCFETPYWSELTLRSAGRGVLPEKMPPTRKFYPVKQQIILYYEEQ